MDKLENVLALLETLEEGKVQDVRISQQIKLNDIRTTLKSYIADRIHLAESISASRVDEYSYHENVARLDELIKIANKINTLT
jgi:hypothetical protein